MDTLLKVKYALKSVFKTFVGDFPSKSNLPIFIQMNTNTDINITELEQELAQHIITALNLDISLDEIDPLAPLYGDEGLGIDSIDVLEISLVLTKQYGVQLRSDDEHNAEIFASLRNLANHIQQHRTK